MKLKFVCIKGFLKELCFDDLRLFCGLFKIILDWGSLIRYDSFFSEK